MNIREVRFLALGIAGGVYLSGAVDSFTTPGTEGTNNPVAAIQRLNQECKKNEMTTDIRATVVLKNEGNTRLSEITVFCIPVKGNSGSG